jgi:hypothetical protein
MFRPFIFILLFASIAAAQRPDAEARLTAGWVGFLDEGPDHHVLAGGAVRYYLTPRLSFEPELMYFAGENNHWDIALTPNLAFDFRGGGSAVPYVVGGVGWMHSKFGRFTTDDVYVSGRFGVKLFMTPGIYFAPEIGIGWEPHVRISGTVGFRF